MEERFTMCLVSCRQIFAFVFKDSVDTLIDVLTAFNYATHVWNPAQHIWNESRSPPAFCRLLEGATHLCRVILR